MEIRDFSPYSANLQSAFESDDPAHSTKVLEKGNVDALKLVVESLGTKDMAPLMMHLDPDVELEIHAPGFFPFTRRAKGAENVRNAVAYNFSILENQRPEIVTVVAQGTMIDVVLHETGRLKKTTQAYEVMLFQQFSFRDGKVIRILEVAAIRTPD